MPVKVLLRGFTPEIPEDQPVTFSKDLPKSVLCVQCDNVSSKLYLDPHGHGYCGSCVGMCTTEDGFNCSTCEENFDVQQLVLDDSTRSKLHKEMLICPHSTQSEAVEIPFPALKAHLKGCCCKDGSGVLNRGKQDEGIQPKAVNPAKSAEPKSLNLEQPAQYKEVNPEEPSQPSSLQSFQVSTCPVCNQVMPKKLINQHVKSCLKSPQAWRGDSLQCDVAAQQEGIRKPPDQASKHFPGPTGGTEVTSTPSLHRLVNDLQNEVRELKRALSQKTSDIELLQATVTALQEDIRSVQIRCETRMAKAEKSSIDLEEQRVLLQEFVAANDEERKKELGEVHGKVADMREFFEGMMDGLQQRVDKLDAQPHEADEGWQIVKGKNRRR